MSQKEYCLYLWGGSWLAFTWGSYFVVMAYWAYKRRVYQARDDRRAL
jgi:hypothetical protein